MSISRPCLPASDPTDLCRQTLSAKAAAALDKELMSSGAFSIDQLMELAGLSVSQAGAYTACSMWLPASLPTAQRLLASNPARWGKLGVTMITPDNEPCH